MPRGDQVVRQWRLFQLVSRPGGLTIEAGACELGCSVRTVWRDLRALQDAGFPVYDERADDGRRGIWRVEAGFRHGLPVPLMLDEVVALVLSEKLLAPAGASPLGPAVASLVAKVRALLGPRALELLDAMAERVGARVFGAKLQAGAVDHLPRIQQALRERRALRVRYFSMSRTAETVRRVDPYHLTYWNGGLYVVGYCHLREAVRMFAVERVRGVEPLDATFTVPAGFDVEEYLRSAWGLIRGERVTVVVVFAATVAPYVRERLWHPSQRVRELPGGRLELTLEVADTIEVRRWLLGFGTEAEVAAPAALREALRVEAAKLAAVLASPRKPPARIEAGGTPAATPSRVRRRPGAPARRLA